MQIITKTTDEREVTLRATIHELKTLYDATRAGRKTRAMNETLEEFGDLLAESDRDLKTLAVAEEDTDANT